MRHRRGRLFGSPIVRLLRTTMAAGMLLAVTACSGPSTDSSQAPVTGATGAPAGTGGLVGTAEPGGVATAGPGGGDGDAAVTVVVTGGPHAGSYTGTENPNCSQGIVGVDGWGVQYSLAEAGPTTLSSLQMVVPAAGHADDENSMFAGIEFKMTATIGSLLDGAIYDITVATEASGSESEGQGSATVEDAGATAVIRATGTTVDGVTIEATVNCPSVTRV